MANDFPRIEVTDCNGATALLYLKMSENEYYGGCTHVEYLRQLPFVYGPHVWQNLASMLDLIAKIANRPLDHPSLAYHLAGGSPVYCSEAITREMHVGIIATVLGCTEQAVRDHYGQVVLIPQEVTSG